MSVRISKFLSLVLRHRPAKAGLVLEEGGWVRVDDLLRGAKAAGVQLDRALLERVVQENDKQRFAFSKDGTRIRANQGHSVTVDLQLEAQAPPGRLFHGTVDRFLKAIEREGLRPGKRHHVHLSPDEQTATQVGQRRGRPIVLTIDAGRMHADGFVFYCSANGVWLTDHVPPAYLTRPAGAPGEPEGLPSSAEG